MASREEQRNLLNNNIIEDELEDSCLERLTPEISDDGFEEYFSIKKAKDRGGKSTNGGGKTID